MEGRRSQQEAMAWGSLLSQESTEVSNRAKKLFSRAKSALSVGTGHTITGISGNDRALACVCLCLIKINLPTCNAKIVQTSLQRTSGVKAVTFSNALKELRLILQTGSSIKSSPTKESPKKREKSILNGNKDIIKDSVIDSGRKGKEVIRVIAGNRDSLMKSSPVKRPATIESDSEDPFLLSSTRRKRVKIAVNIASSSKNIKSDLHSETPSSAISSSAKEATRIIHKTPLNLPIKKPIKPMCIFQSQPIFNIEKEFKPNVNFSDWNWKLNLCQSHWSLDDIYEWEKWQKKSIESFLS